MAITPEWRPMFACSQRRRACNSICTSQWGLSCMPSESRRQRLQAALHSLRTETSQGDRTPLISWGSAGDSVLGIALCTAGTRQTNKLSSSRWEGSHLEPSHSFSFGLKNWLEKERKLTKLPNTLKIQLRVNSEAKWNLVLLEILVWIKIPQKSSWLVNLIALSKHVHKAALVDTQRMFTQPYRMRLCCCRKMDADHHVKQEKLSSGQWCYRGK